MLENFLDRVKRYFWFSRTELNGFLLTTFVFAFIFSFDKWGLVEFDFSTGLINFLLAVVICSISLFVHHAGQRLMALKLGVKAEQKIWWPGLIIALLLVIISFGKIKVYAASAVFISLIPHYRLGAHRYGLSVSTLGKVAMSGPIFNVFLATIAIFFEWTGVLPVSISNPFFLFNLYLAAWNLLPIPPLDGSRVVYYSRLVYVFLISSVVGYIVLIWLFDWYSYFSALAIGVACWLLFLIFFEAKK